MQIDHHESNQTDRNIHKEDNPPVRVSHDQAAGDRSEHGADERRNRDEAHGADQFRFGERAHQRQTADGYHHRAATALQNAARDELMDARGDAAKKRPERKQPDRRREHPARSKPVRHPSADGNEDRKAQRVAREHGLHAERRHLQRSEMTGTAVFRIVVSSDSMKNATATSQGRSRLLAADGA